MLKVDSKNMLILAVLSVLLSCGLVSGLDLHNQDKTTVIASGEGDVLGGIMETTRVITWDETGFTKTSGFSLNYLGVNQVSIDRTSSLTVLGADGSTSTYGNTLTQDLKFSGDQDRLSLGGAYNLDNGKSTATVLTFKNPKSGMEVEMDYNELEKNPTLFIKKFVDAMDLGIGYDRIQGLESHVGIVDSETVTANGMEFEYSLGKNTWVDS